ncbi:hypothetical protein RRG08_005174 [Elysia crispata]|uniref:Uncharacterized protein n=1 Tax=Elysia crispata TaxID=231223 RepID=A0AAE0ZIX2_9GAST|nr:hypothetical protein RRG08_005174 [Elysia crispata]
MRLVQPDTRLGVNGETEEEIIYTILHAYLILPSSPRYPKKYLDKIAQDYLEQFQSKEKLIGKMSSVSIEEFTEILSYQAMDDVMWI